MRKEYSLLLIGVSDIDPWRQVIEAAARALGRLCVAREIEAFRLIQQHAYDIIIIDAAKVEDVYLLVSFIYSLCPDTKIVVVTTSPTWRRARKAFRAGATDYFRKSMTETEIRSALEASLSKVSTTSSDE